MNTFICYERCTTCKKAQKWLDGMLVKRPLLITDSDILVGFKEAEWEETVL